VHACYRDSRPATLPLAIANRHGMVGHPVVRRADRLIALSQRSRDLFARFGVPEERLSLVPNFCVGVHAAATPAPAEPRFVAVGRLSGEKGFADLLRDWPAGRRLDVIGTGPLATPLAAMAGPDVRVLGHVDNGAWRERLGDYTALVLPSPISEGGVPQTVIEAWEGAVPVIAREGSGGADEVTRTGAGRTYADAAGLARALAEVAAGQSALRPLARATFEARYDERAWTSAMLDVYESVAGGPRQDTGGSGQDTGGSRQQAGRR
jgi:glycosyltransferase involved in cell wall biosynthesis